MFKVMKTSAAAEFKLCAAGPVLVAAKNVAAADPTLPDASFLTGKYDEKGSSTFVIPGSTIKGVIRSRYHDISGKAAANELFGAMDVKAKNIHRGKVSFHDAYADPGTIVVSARKNTAVEPSLQSALPSSLNNAQAVESGGFSAGFRCVNFTDEEMYRLLLVLSEVNSGLVRFGGRKSRGYGVMRVEDFTMTVCAGFSKDLEPDSREFRSLDEALAHYMKAGDKSAG